MAPNRNLPKHLFLTILAIISFCDYLERIQLHGVIDNLTTSTSTNSQTAHSTTCYNSATAYERDSNHDIALALLVEKCHSDTDSTISSSSYVTGDEETRKQDWLSSCYPIEISSSARSIGHCTDAALYIHFAGARLSAEFDKETNIKHALRCPNSTRLHSEYPIEEFFDLPQIRNYWMPNVEHAKKTQKRLLKSTHTLIAKTRAAFNIFTDYFKHDRGRAPRIVYIGHSSVDPLVHFGNNLPEKNFENVFHAYGHAGTKGTVELVKCWARHPEWPTLTVVGNKNDDKIPFGFNDPDNIVFYNKVGHEELGVLHSEAAIHVYPTSREGFGHALNEARGSGALLVTTNFGPMDEFVHEGYSGFLIDIKYENVEDFQLFGEFMPVQAHVDSEAICNSMEKLLKKSLTERRRMGEAGRAGFLADRMFFKEKVKIIKNEALKLFNGQE